MGHLAAGMFSATLDNPVCRVMWTGPERFEQARRYFLQHEDRGYSLTDCLSFVVMDECDLDQAFATDRHFAEAGFQVLLR